MKKNIKMSEKNMKPLLSIFVLMIATLLVSGCGDSKNETADSKNETVKKSVPLQQETPEVVIEEPKFNSSDIENRTAQMHVNDAIRSLRDTKWDIELFLNKDIIDPNIKERIREVLSTIDKNMNKAKRFSSNIASVEDYLKPSDKAFYDLISSQDLTIDDSGLKEMVTESERILKQIPTQKLQKDQQDLIRDFCKNVIFLRMINSQNSYISSKRKKIIEPITREKTDKLVSWINRNFDDLNHISYYYGASNTLHYSFVDLYKEYTENVAAEPYRFKSDRPGMFVSSNGFSSGSPWGIYAAFLLGFDSYQNLDRILQNIKKSKTISSDDRSTLVCLNNRSNSDYVFEKRIGEMNLFSIPRNIVPKAQLLFHDDGKRHKKGDTISYRYISIDSLYDLDGVLVPVFNIEDPIN